MLVAFVCICRRVCVWWGERGGGGGGISFNLQMESNKEFLLAPAVSTGKFFIIPQNITIDQSL